MCMCVSDIKIVCVLNLLHYADIQHIYQQKSKSYNKLTSTHVYSIICSNGRGMSTGRIGTACFTTEICLCYSFRYIVCRYRLLTILTIRQGRCTMSMSFVLSYTVKSLIMLLPVVLMHHLRSLGGFPTSPLHVSITEVYGLYVLLGCCGWTWMGFIDLGSATIKQNKHL